MKRSIPLCFSILLLSNFYAFAQNPGGVGTNHLKLWLKANSIVAVNGAVLGTWNDNSPMGYNATQAHIAAPDSAPNYEDNAVNNINFNPSVLFDGAKSFMNILGSNGAADPAFVSSHKNKYSVYVVIQPDPSYALGTAAAPGKFFFSGTTGADHFTAGDVRNTGVILDSWNQDDNTTPANSYQSFPLLISYTYDSAVDKRIIYTYGKNVSVNTTGNQATNTGNTAYGIGCQIAANPHIEFYKGTIAELVSYTKSNQSASAQKQEVESYLALKYGLTLNGENYLSSAGAIVWNTASAGAKYNNNIFGIARDDNSGLMQKESNSTGGLPSFTNDFLTIFIGAAKTTDNATNVGTFASGDKSFFMVGSNDDSACGHQWSPGADVPPGVFARLVKQWFTQTTNFTNTDVTLEFAVPACAAVNLVVANLRLLVDDDGDFINSVPLNTVAGSGPALTSITVAGNLVDITLKASYFTSNVGFADAKVHPYFTLGSVSPNTPLPVELLSFNAQSQKDNTVLTKWVTASEVNNALFTVEKTMDGIDYETVGTLSGAGTTSQTNYYSFTDDNPYVGLSYYRLKQTDYDGNSTYSNAVPITYYPADQIAIGNTLLSTSGSFIQVISKTAGAAGLSIYDVTGRRIYSTDQILVSGINKIDINAGIPQGVYIISVQPASGNLIQKKVLAWK